jgi:hypothetical protein
MLSQFAFAWSNGRNLLILRAANLCKQGVTGSIPVASANFFSACTVQHLGKSISVVVI